MTLDNIPGKKVFAQRDVRETPASTATATAVGLTDESYVLVGAGGADLTAERVLTAGTGITLNDGGAGTTITVVTNDGQIDHDALNNFAANEHFTEASIDLDNVTEGTTNKFFTATEETKLTGIETAADVTDTTNVTAAGAAMSGGAFHDGFSDFVANEHLDWTADQGATNIHAGNYTDTNTTYTADEVDLTLTGTVFSLKNKTSYWSCSGYGFETADNEQSGFSHGTGTAIQSTYSELMVAPVYLPHGAIVTGINVYGSDAARTYTLRRITLSDATAATMATAAVNTADTSIDNATIDNSTYGYAIDINTGTHTIYGAYISYTTDYV